MFVIAPVAGLSHVTDVAPHLVKIEESYDNEDL